MPVVINGSTGISGTDGSASTPAVQGTDTNTGMFFPAADTIAFAEGGTEVMRIDSSGNVGIGTSSPGVKLDVAGFTRLGNYSGTFQGVTLQNNNNSASAETINFIDTQNNLGTADSNLFFGHQTDGGSYIALATTPAGSRTSDRRVERARITAAGDLQFNSGYGSVATAYGCRSWVNFNGTGTVAIRASGNVSSITDNGTGDYTVNITTTMPDANYSVVVVTSPQYGSDRRCGVGIASDGLALQVNPTTTAIRFETFGLGNATVDPTFVCVSIFR